MTISYNTLQKQDFLVPLTKPVPIPKVYHTEDAHTSAQLTLIKKEFVSFEYINTKILGLSFKDIPKHADLTVRAEGSTLLVYYDYLNVFLNSALKTAKKPKQLLKRIDKLQVRYEFSNALENLGEPYWAIRHLLCGEVNSTTKVSCMGCGKIRTHKTSSCDIRVCPVCAAKKANKLKHAYRKDLAKHYFPRKKAWNNTYNLRFLTLTFPNISSVDDLDYDYYLKCLNRLLRRKGTEKYPGAKQFIKKHLYKFECPYKTEEQGYNPHFHLLIYSKIIPVEHLSQLWQDATKGTAKIVDIRNISCVKSATNEVIKYCSKADDFCDVNERAKFAIKMKHRRFLGVSGFVADSKSPLVCEDCGCTEWHFVSGSVSGDNLFAEIMQFQQNKSSLLWETT